MTSKEEIEASSLGPFPFRSESPPILPPPPPDVDLTEFSPPPEVDLTELSSSENQQKANLRPCFSARTRDLFRQRMMKRRKENTAGPPPVFLSSTSMTSNTPFSLALTSPIESQQRPNKLPLHIISHGKSSQEKKIASNKTISQGGFKQRKIASPSTRMSLNQDFFDQDPLDLTSEELELSVPGKQQKQSLISPLEDSFEMGGDCQAIPLPHCESIPQQFWTMAYGWIPIVGRDIVACLFSRDWELREASIRRLSREVANALVSSSTVKNASNSSMITPMTSSTPSEVSTPTMTSNNELGNSLQDVMLFDKFDRIWRCAAEIIAKGAEDKVFKVYSASIKSLRTLLAFTTFTSDVSYVRTGIRPILYSILLKCADGKKRMAELSLETIDEFCNPHGFLVGNCGQNGRPPILDLKGLDFVFQILLEEKDTSWQFIMGKLMALDHLMFNENEQIFGLGKEEILICLNISFQNLNNSNSRVAKMALKVFVSAANMVTKIDSFAFEEVWKLVLSLGPTLQLTLKKKFKIALKTLSPPVYEIACKLMDDFTETQSPTNYHHQSVVSSFSNPPPLIRSTSHSPSRSNQTSMLAKSYKKTPKRPAPYAKSKGAIRKKTENKHQFDILNPSLLTSNVVSQSGHCATLKTRQEALPFVEVFGSSSQNLKGHCMPFSDSGGSDENRQHHAITSGYKEGRDWTKSFVLGTGAFSTCFQARDVNTGTLMAVKQIQLNRVQDNEEKARLELLLQQEVNLMSVLDHPNLIRLYGVSEEDCYLNMFIEWMPGGSVSKLLDKHGAFNDTVILRYTQQILQGLEYLHQHGILHRDLKGANLFVDTTGHWLRIGDFGAAACLYSKMTCPGEFRGQLQGTLAFMAPEVLRSESYGRSCDIWSLGCCIIEMATARAPWNASDISNYYCLMYKIACSQEPPSIPGFLSPGVRDLAEKCLQLVPEHRSTAKDLLNHSAFSDFLF